MSDYNLLIVSNVLLKKKPETKPSQFHNKVSKSELNPSETSQLSYQNISKNKVLEILERCKNVNVRPHFEILYFKAFTSLVASC